MRANDRKHFATCAQNITTRGGQPDPRVPGDVLSVSAMVVFVDCSTFVHNLHMSGSLTGAADLTRQADVQKS